MLYCSTYIEQHNGLLCLSHLKLPQGSSLQDTSALSRSLDVTLRNECAVAALEQLLQTGGPRAAVQQLARALGGPA
jgi:hypothetical protein